MNKVTIPQKISEDIAYLTGFLFGDGHLCLRKNKHEYSIYCTGNLKDERVFYENYIRELFIKIFEIKPKVKISRYDNSINLIVYSKDLLFYLNKKCGIPIGAKSHKVIIPRKFEKTNKLKRAFIRGFADADFSLCLKKRYRVIPYYPVITGTSKSKTIILQISKFLKTLGITFSLDLDRIDYDKRFRKNTIKSSIHIYGKKNLQKWTKEIGFRNSKYLNEIKKIE